MSRRHKLRDKQQRQADWLKKTAEKISNGTPHKKLEPVQLDGPKQEQLLTASGSETDEENKALLEEPKEGEPPPDKPKVKGFQLPAGIRRQTAEKKFNAGKEEIEKQYKGHFEFEIIPWLVIRCRPRVKFYRQDEGGEKVAERVKLEQEALAKLQELINGLAEEYLVRFKPAILEWDGKADDPNAEALRGSYGATMLVLLT